MTPLPINPTIIVLINSDTKVIQLVASNIAPLPELKVIVTDNVEKFANESLGKPFNQGITKDGHGVILYECKQ